MRTDVEWRKEFEDRYGKIRDGNGVDLCMEFDALIRAIQAEAHVAGIADALGRVSQQCRSTAEMLLREADASDIPTMVVSKAMARAYQTVAELSEEAERKALNFDHSSNAAMADTK